MSFIRFHKEAEAELLASAATYESQREGLGREFRKEVEAAVERVRQHPQIWPQHSVSGARKAPVRRFPYTIFFFQVQATLWIIAVAHNRRRPNYWAGRRPG